MGGPCVLTTLNKVYVMLCYVMLCYVMLCYVMMSKQERIKIQVSKCIVAQQESMRFSLCTVNVT